VGEVTPMNRKERRHWDRYVADARETYSEVELGEGNVIQIRVPSTDQLNKLNEAERSGDIWQQIEVLFGEHAAAFRAVAADVPVTALLALVQDVVADLGLSASPGNATSSSA
jgi:hypothetical protein